MQNTDLPGRQQHYAKAWTDYLATEQVKTGHLVTGHAAAMLAGMQTAASYGAIVDLGCGTGALLADLKAAGTAFEGYLGVDSNSVLLAQAGAEAQGRAAFMVADLGDPAGQNEALAAAARRARPEETIFALVRVLNYLPDLAASMLLGKLAEGAAGAQFLILEAYPGPLDRPDKDNPLKSAIEEEMMDEARVVHHLRDPFQYVDFLSARSVGELSARAAYLRGPAAPSHFTITGRFGANA
ncbi:MAG TPA: hypothetical protein DDZ68_16300 [Parvularcula sp.]|nr:hypothetical protein [Parvularcula sp.]